MFRLCASVRRVVIALAFVEMAREFVGGDRVFAKMRGYPPWPARVEGVAASSPKVRKYRVFFYGTLQRGVCRGQDVFDFDENKERLGKGVRRKGFAEALAQIEGLIPTPDIPPNLSNNNNIHDYPPTSVVWSVNNNVDQSNENGADKNNVSVKNVENNVGERGNVESYSLVSNGEVSSSSARSEDNGNCVRNPNERANRVCDSTPCSGAEVASLHPANETNRQDVLLKNKTESRNCIRRNNLSVQSFTERCNGGHKDNLLESRTNAGSFCPVVVLEPLSAALQSKRKSAPNKKRQHLKSASNAESSNSTNVDDEGKEPAGNVAKAISRSGRVIKRRCVGGESEGTSAKRRVRETSKGAKKGNGRRRSAGEKEEGGREQEEAVRPAAEPAAVCPTAQKKQQKQPQQRRCSSSSSSNGNGGAAKKCSARSWLATENSLMKLDAMIKVQLGQTQAHPGKCLDYMDELLQLDVMPLMLKKNPEVVETMKRLRRYVGNTRVWNLSEEECRAFTHQAALIRAKATCIFEKFQRLFGAPDIETFLKLYADGVVDFQLRTWDWPVAKVYALVSEPKGKVTHPAICAENNVKDPQTPVKRSKKCSKSRDGRADDPSSSQEMLVSSASASTNVGNVENVENHASSRNGGVDLSSACKNRETGNPSLLCKVTTTNPTPLTNGDLEIPSVVAGKKSENKSTAGIRSSKSDCTSTTQKTSNRTKRNAEKSSTAVTKKLPKDNSENPGSKSASPSSLPVATNGSVENLGTINSNPPSASREENVVNFGSVETTSSSSSSSPPVFSSRNNLFLLTSRNGMKSPSAPGDEQTEPPSSSESGYSSAWESSAGPRRGARSPEEAAVAVALSSAADAQRAEAQVSSLPLLTTLPSTSGTGRVPASRPASTHSSSDTDVSELSAEVMDHLVALQFAEYDRE